MKKSIVLKLGTSTLTGGTDKLDKIRMLEIVRQCARLKAKGHEIVLVTSGAIAAGREFLNYPKLPEGVAYKQMLAAVGQVKLIQHWEQLFSIFSLHVGQMLLSRADLEHRERFLNARDMLLTLMENDIIPIVNENDAVATAEIKVGDNDNLSAMVAALGRADLLILLTDIDGLYTGNPHNDPNAKLLHHVHEINDDIRTMAGDAVSGLGTGGMETKIQAASFACSAGIDVVIARGNEEAVIERIVNGEEIGTFFHAAKKNIDSKKQWVFSAPVAGEIFVDEGAEQALYKGGNSLLPIGISRFSGVFSRGEVLLIKNLGGKVLGRGVSRYNSEDLVKISGRKSSEISSILGYEHGPVAVHRDDMVVMETAK